MKVNSYSVKFLKKRGGGFQVRALMAVPVETLSIELHDMAHAFPILSLPDRRGRKPYRQKQWCLVRAIEKLAFDVRDRSSGAFAQHLEACSMADAILVAEKAAVTAGVLVQEELDAGE
jgi:hypothetical protein